MQGVVPGSSTAVPDSLRVWILCLQNKSASFQMDLISLFLEEQYPYGE